MVKTGEERSEKFAMKHDAYVNMLRAKKMDKSSLEKFQRDLYLHVKLQEYISGLDLPYGKLGEFSDLANKFLFKGTDVLADLERFEIPLSYFEELLNFISIIIYLFQVCAYPTSKIFSRITVEPMPYQILFPKKEDYLIDLTAISELETFYLEPERKEVGFIESQVCAHNTVSTIPLFLKSPLVEFEIIAKEITLDISVSFHNAYKKSPTLNIGVVKTP